MQVITVVSESASSDGLGKKTKRTTSLREKGKRSIGGQKGHSGHTLRQSAEPDHHHLIKAPAECSCGSCLSGAENGGGVNHVSYLTSNPSTLNGLSITAWSSGFCVRLLLLAVGF